MRVSVASSSPPHTFSSHYHVPFTIARLVVALFVAVVFVAMHLLTSRTSSLRALLSPLAWFDQRKNRLLWQRNDQ